MNELREKARQFAISKMTEERARLYNLWNSSERPIEHPFIDCLLSDFIQSQPINKELEEEVKKLKGDNALQKLQLEAKKSTWIDDVRDRQIAKLEKKIELKDELLKESSEYLLDFVDGLAGEICQYQNLKDRIEESLKNKL